MNATRKRLDLYRRVFGRRGVWLAARAHFSSAPWETEASAPGIRHPLTVRLKTSDIETFDKVFLEAEYALSLSKAPRTILDAGANAGFASVYFANAYPGARIFAMEPEASNFELLTRNVAPYPNVVPIRAALWKHSGTIDLLDPGIGHWGFRVGEDVSGPDSRIGTVETRTVADIMAEHGCDSIDLVKIDIEGSEREVFADAAAWIGKVGVLAVELHDRYRVGCSRSFYLATQGFELELQRGENVFLMRREFAPASTPSNV